MLFVCPAVFADDEATQESSTVKDDIEAQKEKATIEGHVEQEALDTEAALKDLGTSLHHFKRASVDVFTEVQREDLVVVGEPDVIGPMIVPAVTGSGLLGTGQFLPARKKFIDYFMIQIEKLLPIVEKETKAIILPDDASAEAKSEKAEIDKIFEQLKGSARDLDQVTAGPKYDNMKIAKQATLVHDLVGKADKCRKSLYELIKKEVHDVKRAEKETQKQIKREKKELERAESQ